MPQRTLGWVQTGCYSLRNIFSVYLCMCADIVRVRARLLPVDDEREVAYIMVLEEGYCIGF